VNDAAWWARVVQARTERDGDDRWDQPTARRPRRSSRKTSSTRGGWSTATRGSGGVQILLSVALQNGLRIASASPEEQALLDAHGFGSRRCSERR
jgi:hypothetical protein